MHRGRASVTSEEDTLLPFAERAGKAADEIRLAVTAIAATELEAMLSELASTKLIVCHGLGSEGLMMKALAMRLYHMGLDAHVAGEMTCPPVGPGDLFLVSIGPGRLATAEALIAVARDAGARVACITAEPEGPGPLAADLVLVIPAQTMARDQGSTATSILPMGSLFEGAMFLVFELIVLALRDRLGITAADMRARHTNLE
jgi:6-phospho-3-hexuloisomerase